MEYVLGKQGYGLDVNEDLFLLLLPPLVLGGVIQMVHALNNHAGAPASLLHGFCSCAKPMSLAAEAAGEEKIAQRGELLRVH